jgi:hypothetical protein
VKARRTKGGYVAELTEQEGRDLYQFMAMKKAMGNLDIECPHDALGVIIAFEVQKVIHGPQSSKSQDVK